MSIEVRRRLRRFASAGLGGVLTLALASAVGSQAAQPQPRAASAGASLAVELVGFEHARGRARVALWRRAEGFPDEMGKEAAHHESKIANGRVKVTFSNLTPGPVAVSAHHDEDGDGEMDTAIFGIPTEGYGFSRDAEVSFGPPSFESAKIQLKAGERRRIVVHMRY